MSLFNAKAVGHLINDKEALRQEVDTLRADLASARTELETLREELKAAKEENERLTAYNEELRREVPHIESDTMNGRCLACGEAWMCQGYVEDSNRYDTTLKITEATLLRYKEALEFYADEKNYYHNQERTLSNGEVVKASTVDNDHGETARRVLSEDTKPEEEHAGS